MGLFNKKKKQTAAEEVSKPGIMSVAPMSAPNGSPQVVGNGLQPIEEAIQYRVSPGTSIAPPADFAAPTGQQIYEPDQYITIRAESGRNNYATRYSRVDSYERSAPPTPRGYRDCHRGDHYDDISTYRSDSRSMRSRYRGGIDECRSDDGSCYRASSFCSRSRQPSHCDCVAKTHHSRHGGDISGTTEVYHTTYACYDPNCKGDSSCKHWKMTEETCHKDPFSRQTGYNEMTMATNQVATPPPVHPATQHLLQQPIVTTTTYQTTSYPPMSIHGQMSITPPVPIMVQQPAVMMGQPYIVNRRQVPMTVGGVPIVVPAFGSGARVVGAVPTQPGYPTVTTRPLQF